MSLQENLKTIKATIPEQVTLVAVSKTKPLEAIQEAYDVGHKIFGENKVQELVQKWEALPKDIEWHMIGHLQRNKVKYIAGFVSLIHSVDRLKLLQEIDKQAQKHQRILSCLLQIHIAQEDTKFGLTVPELEALIASEGYKALTHVKVVGLMGMATFTTDKVQIRKEFAHLKSVFETLKAKLPDITVLSMGMSSDYPIAIDEGSTLVRVGSRIFGARNY